MLIWALLKIGGLLASGVLLFGFIFVCCYIYREHSKYSHLPGPKRTSFFFGNLSEMTKGVPMPLKAADMFIHILTGLSMQCDYAESITRHETYGPVFVFFFLHQVFIFITDPATVKSILMNNAHVKPATYSFFHSLFGERFMGNGLLTERDHEKWNVHRRIFNPAFYRKHLMELVGTFNQSSDKMVLRLKQYADSGSPVPLLETINRVTLDVIAKAGFGIDQETILEDTPFVDYVVTCFKGLDDQIKDPLGWMKPTRWSYQRRVRDAVRSLRSTGRELIIEARRAQVEGRELKSNILSNIMKHLGDGESFDLETMIDHFVTFFVADYSEEDVDMFSEVETALDAASSTDIVPIIGDLNAKVGMGKDETTLGPFGMGQDTTASLLSFTIVEIGKHPEVMERVREEIDTVIGDKDYVDYEDVMKMEYTLRVLKETLRLYPPAAGTSRTIAHDINVCGYNIPTGSTVQFTHTASSRMEEFWKNPMTFDPDRFLRDDDKPLYAYFPFSLGARSCIGQQFALIEARVMLAKLYKNFDLKLDPSQSFDIVEQVTLKPAGQCTNWVYTRRR